MNKPKQLIMIGGGPSLNEGIEKGLWEKLKGRFTIGMNFNYRYFDSTILAFVDSDFYTGSNDKWKDTNQRRLEHIEKIKQMPMILGQNDTKIKEVYPNTILFNHSEDDLYHGRNSIKYNLIHRQNL